MAKDRQGLNSEEASGTPSSKVRKKQSSKEPSSRIAKDRKSDPSTSDKGKYVKKSPAKVAKPSTDSKLELLDQKWPERFSRLEAVLLSRTFNPPETVFKPTVVVQQNPHQPVL